MYNCWCLDGFQGLRCDYKYSKAPSLAPQFEDKRLQGSGNRTESQENDFRVNNETVDVSRDPSQEPIRLEFITRDDSLILNKRTEGNRLKGEFLGIKSQLFGLIYNVPLVVLIVIILIVIIIK